MSSAKAETKVDQKPEQHSKSSDLVSLTSNVDDRVRETINELQVVMYGLHI